MEEEPPMATPPSDRERTRTEAEANEIDREMELIRRRAPENRSTVRRLVLTVITTTLVALALWMAMR
jgi:hypothetical protein